MLKFKNIASLLFCCLFLICLPSSAYADEIASNSNAVYSDVITDAIASDSNAEKEIDDNEIYVESFDAEILLPYLENIDGLVTDIHAQIVPDEVSDQGQYSVMSLDGDEISAFALTGDFGIDSNVIIYEGTWSGESFRAVFPAQYEQYLIVTDEGYLYNLSGSSVTGRLFQDEVNYQDYEYSSIILNSVLGNVANTVYNYGYPSYVRTYYLSNGRITNSDQYGLFRVDNIVRTDSADPVRIGNNYILILILLGGMNLLCCMKRSRN